MKRIHNITFEGVQKPVSRLALGTAFYRLKDKENCFDIMDCFLEYDGTFLDTGRVYGESERVIGLWMESRGARERMIIATKGGHGAGYGLSREGFVKTVEAELRISLECLRTGYVDLYMLHRDSPEVPVGEIIEFLNSQLNSRRIHAFGASNWEYDRISEANTYARNHNLKGFSTVSNNISLAVATGPFYPGLISVDKDGEEWHRQTGIPLIAWSSQARGFFTGRYAPEMSAAALRTQNPLTAKMIEVYGTDDNFERLLRAAELGRKKGGYSATQIALAWLFQKPFPLLPIVGPQTKAELESCFRATSLKITRREAEWLNLEKE